MGESTERIGSLETENQEVIEEIERHKWIESEKKGYDVGEYWAAIEWIFRYYETWKKHKYSSC